MSPRVDLPLSFNTYTQVAMDGSGSQELGASGAKGSVSWGPTAGQDFLSKEEQLSAGSSSSLDGLHCDTV